MTITQESAFESNIEAHLLGHGWGKVAPASYDRSLGLFPDEVVAFVQASQPKQWAQLVARHGGEPTAREKFVGYSQLAVVPWLVKRCCRARWALRSRIRAW